MEMVEKFDSKRIPLGKIEERYKRIEGEFKQSMHIWIMNKNGEFLIQKRSEEKRVFPGMWSITGGGVDVGETTLQTVIRECKEELSIDVDMDKLELMMMFRTKKDFTDVWLLRQDIEIDNIKLQEEEVSEVKWISDSDLRKMIEENEFAPNVAFYYEFFSKLIDLKE